MGKTLNNVRFFSHLSRVNKIRLGTQSDAPLFEV